MIYIWDNPCQPDGDVAKIVFGDGDPLFSWAAPGDGVLDRGPSRSRTNGARLGS